MHVKINWLYDEHDCETCGVAFAQGAEVFFDGEKVIECVPKASCFGGADWDTQDICELIFKKLGHTIDM